MYNIKHTQNALLVTAGGFFTPQEGQDFIKSYNDAVKKINPKETKLILDGSSLRTSTQEMLPILKNCLEMYIKDNFQKIYMVKYASAITNSQVSRLGKENGFTDKVVMIDSIQEALNA